MEYDERVQEIGFHYKEFYDRFSVDRLYQTDFKNLDPYTNFDTEVSAEACYALSLVYAAYIANSAYPVGGQWEVYSRLLQLEREGYIGDPNEGLMFVNQPQAVLDFIANGKLKFRGFGSATDNPTSVLTISRWLYKRDSGKVTNHFILGSPISLANGYPYIDTIRGGSVTVANGKVHSLRQIEIL